MRFLWAFRYNPLRERQLRIRPLSMMVKMILYASAPQSLPAILSLEKVFFKIRKTSKLFTI
ncbi:MAG: hypothetical protein LBK44_04070 [Spirochaetales bacterium]|nr:hypothetical protein [Spirochaetales bacterium]